jgi:hypothetical protein
MGYYKNQQIRMFSEAKKDFLPSEEIIDKYCMICKIRMRKIKKGYICCGECGGKRMSAKEYMTRLVENCRNEVEIVCITKKEVTRKLKYGIL